MTGPTRAIPVSKRDPTARQIIASWRRLTGGTSVRDPDRPTIAACSGGADSSALVLALAATPAAVRVVHVLHRMRPAAEARADAEAARELAERTGCAFELIELGEHEPTEAGAARARRGALAEAAGRHATPFVATGHTADDQLETLLMRLARGAGPRGMRGVLPSRRCGGATLVRPMLAITREQALELCRRAGWRWREDRTNLETDRVRSSLRRTVTPALRAVLTDAARGAVRTAGTMALHEAALDRRARELLDSRRRGRHGLTLTDEDIGGLDAAVLGALLRRALRLGGGARLDRLRGADVRTLHRWLTASRAPGERLSLGPIAVLRERECVTISIDHGTVSAGPPGSSAGPDAGPGTGPGAGPDASPGAGPG